MGCQFLRTKPTLSTMFRFVVLALAGASAEATPSELLAAHGLAYGHAYAGFAGAYPGAYGAPLAYAGHGVAPVAAAYHAAPVAAAVAPVAAAVPAPYHGVPVAHGLGLPEASTYALPPVRAVAEAPIVEHVVEPVEQWGYKVAY